MALSRRAAIRGGLAALAAAWGGAAFYRRQEDRVLAVIARQFGTAAAGHEDSLAFARDFAADWAARHPAVVRAAERLTPPGIGPSARFETLVTKTYLRATTIVLAEETGAPLIYIGLPDPYATPCGNPLSAQWL